MLVKNNEVILKTLNLNMIKLNQKS